jgi:hypothetical protein
MQTSRGLALVDIVRGIHLEVTSICLHVSQSREILISSCWQVLLLKTLPALIFAKLLENLADLE